MQVTDMSEKNNWHPKTCPITLRPFFMWIEHPDKGMVPTYGGPYDSFTIPEPKLPERDTEFHDIEFSCHHYDHDKGGWSDDEDPCMRIVTESNLIKFGAWSEE